MTGLIYVILIALWGVVLVPRWLRHHDESRRQREAERLQRALSPHERPDLYEDDDPDGRSASWGEYLRSLTSVDHATFLASIRSPSGRQAQRRRNVLVALGGGLVVGMLGSIAGFLPSAVSVLFALLLVSYVSAMFLQMRQHESRHEDLDLAPGHRQVPFESHSWTGASSDGVRVVPGGQAAASTWDARETSLPTYVSKSKASKIPRRIDLTREGWTGAGMVEQARQQQASPALQQQFDREFAALAPDTDVEVEDYANGTTGADGQGYYRRAANE